MITAKEASNYKDSCVQNVNVALDLANKKILEACENGSSEIMVHVKSHIYELMCSKLIEFGFSIHRNRSEGGKYQYDQVASLSDYPLPILISWGNPDIAKIRFMGGFC